MKILIQITMIIPLLIGANYNDYPDNNTTEKSRTENPIQLHEGSGVFNWTGGQGNEDKLVKIFYHKPKNFNSNSKILLVIPGSGRNGDSYRDSWVENSEKYNVLVVSPMYTEKDYDFGQYHFGGVIGELDVRNSINYVDNSNQVLLDENTFKFKINSNSTNWLFNDFDRLFDDVKEATGSKQKQYDIFGHSAGGQILHRFAIFKPHSKADRILASNAGSYTLAHFNVAMPFGLMNSSVGRQGLKKSYKTKLVLFLGELDNEHEQGGLLLRSKTVDKQGTNRLARGKHFYNTAFENARKMNSKFNWKLKIIKNIGHNYRKMGNAAAHYLYNSNNSLVNK